jgi:hypothetical protein
MNMNFEWALARMQEGLNVTRDAWDNVDDGVGQYLCFCLVDTTWETWIFRSLSQPYMVFGEDMLAEDWKLAKKQPEFPIAPPIGPGDEMTFQEALTKIKNGYSVKRPAWEVYWALGARIGKKEELQAKIEKESKVPTQELTIVEMAMDGIPVMNAFLLGPRALAKDYFIL